MAELQTVDAKRFEHLTAALFREVRTEYLAHSRSQASVFVVLNALAFVTGTVLAGTDVSVEAVEFFKKAVADTIALHTEDDAK